MLMTVNIISIHNSSISILCLIQDVLPSAMLKFELQLFFDLQHLEPYVSFLDIIAKPNAVFLLCLNVWCRPKFLMFHVFFTLFCMTV